MSGARQESYGLIWTSSGIHTLAILCQHTKRLSAEKIKKKIWLEIYGCGPLSLKNVNNGWTPSKLSA